MNNNQVQTKVNEKQNPTFGVVIGRKYRNHKYEYDFIVEALTAYNSEGQLMGTEDFPIYVAIGTIESLLPNGQKLTRPNSRLSCDYIAFDMWPREFVHKIESSSWIANNGGL